MFICEVKIKLCNQLFRLSISSLAELDYKLLLWA
jgi:hypothetical protein